MVLYNETQDGIVGIGERQHHGRLLCHRKFKEFQKSPMIARFLLVVSDDVERLTSTTRRSSACPIAPAGTGSFALCALRPLRAFFLFYIPLIRLKSGRWIEGPKSLDNINVINYYLLLNGAPYYLDSLAYLFTERMGRF